MSREEAGADVTTTGIEFLDLYRAMLAHQMEHSGERFFTMPGEPPKPHYMCFQCFREGKPDLDGIGRRIRREYSFAVPDEGALATIAEYSPNGVVEIGAGSGYWAMLLQERGVDVVAYDPDPYPDPWTAVVQGDHAAAAEHPTRTLLLCWPSHAETWPAQALECYAGDTVVYIGTGTGGYTADDRFHALLDESPPCRHVDDDRHEPPCPADCPARVTPLFELRVGAPVPQWFGITDWLSVYGRRRPRFGADGGGSHG